jgi:pimeloyl-ACP methyl ester carboxylesterase
VTALLTGCASGDGMLPTMSVQPPPPTTQTRAAPGGIGPRAAGIQPHGLMVTAHQRGYLDALRAAGVRPSTDLMALSIGSYVCQARAAKQPDAAVHDYVVPLVRGDVRNTSMNVVAPPPSEVDAITADYIRIATERLC